ncbi:MAG: hypothetical protein ACKO6Q_05030 [Bacteroidota bacterium]
MLKTISVVRIPYIYIHIVTLIVFVFPSKSLCAQPDGLSYEENTLVVRAKKIESETFSTNRNFKNGVLETKSVTFLNPLGYIDSVRVYNYSDVRIKTNPEAFKIVTKASHKKHETGLWVLESYQRGCNCSSRPSRTTYTYETAKADTNTIIQQRFIWDGKKVERGVLLNSYNKPIIYVDES